MAVLITGGAGYLGSHACVEFAQAGYDCVVLDNLCNGQVEAVRRAERLTGKNIAMVEGDLRNQTLIEATLEGYSCDSVVHFAGLKSVAESTARPLHYYDVNVAGSICLLKAMQRCGVRRLVYSSSATVYGEPTYLPIDEKHRLTPINPYGWTKMQVETLLEDLVSSDPNWAIAVLRYFNPTGAHQSGLIGEHPGPESNNLMPVISRVATGQQQALKVYGDDYQTKDGSGVRDYIHVMDLMAGHLRAMESILGSGREQILTVNLGAGCGYSVYELVTAFEKVSNLKIKLEISQRRPGDVATSFADISFAAEQLGWRPQRDLEEMCKDSWNWICKNPKGYS
ncbi:MAG: UDP-glucose 4-epimerase GalE [Rhizobiaceae bacterium]